MQMVRRVPSGRRKWARSAESVRCLLVVSSEAPVTFSPISGRLPAARVYGRVATAPHAPRSTNQPRVPSVVYAVCRLSYTYTCNRALSVFQNKV